MISSDKHRLKTAFHILFFIMSPFFPANNVLEVMLMTSIANWIGSISPALSDSMMLSSYIYWAYNMIAIVGLIITGGDAYKPSLSMFFKLCAFSLVLVAASFLPDNFSYIGLSMFSVFYLLQLMLKNIKRHKTMTGKTTHRKL